MVETNSQPEVRISPKSFGAAVSLCVIFGPAGIHHFYLGNWLLDCRRVQGRGRPARRISRSVGLKMQKGNRND